MIKLKETREQKVIQLEEMLEGEFAEGDWDTVGGLIFTTLGHVPEVGESIETNGVRLRVERMQGRRITSVRVDHLDEPADVEREVVS